MSTSESDLARRIAKQLERGLHEIDPATLVRLKAARLAALERARPEPVSVLAWAGGYAGARPRLRSSRYLLPILGVVLTVSAMVYWQQQGRIEDPVEIDAKLLSSELPIDALIDKGLDRWLQR
jgi:hypothetical protein